MVLGTRWAFASAITSSGFLFVRFAARADQLPSAMLCLWVTMLDGISSARRMPACVRCSSDRLSCQPSMDV
jgi:hypothetical protein